VPADITMAGEALMNSETPISPFEQTPEQRSLIGRLIRFCLTNKLVVGLFVLAMVVAGLTVAPFDWQLGGMTRYPIVTDAIPDIGENQQIVFTAWPGRSPQDVEDQITYPLTVSLLGVPGVKTIRSYSFFGFSSVYVIFKEGVEFYWSRTRVLEKLNSLPAGTLPADVRPALGPDATALGQVYWYTLEGRDEQGKPAGGWDLDELRTIQDWYARYWLLSADGAAEVASIGGYVREYQVDVDPDAMRAYGVTLGDVAQAVRASNLDVGAKTLELNRVEYFVRGVGFIKSVADIESSVVKVRDNVPILIKQVATVTLGPAMRRGALDKGGAQAVGGVVVARYGDNPLRVIKNIKAKIAETAEALPAKAVVDFSKVTKQQVSQYAKAHGFEAYAGTRLDSKAFLAHLRKIPPKDRPDWITISRVTVVPFYDRTGLIYETLGTLNDAISLEILITVIVIIVMVVHLRSSFIIAITLPLAVLLCFIGMKAFGVDANILALSGIVIAIGTIVDMGIVVCENTLRHLDQASEDEPTLAVVHRATSEVGSAVLTAVLTTIVSFLPVFTMIGAEGKLFKPLAYTKTFALLASIIIALTVVPPACHILFCGKISGRRLRHGLFGFIGIVGLGLMGWGFAQGAFLLVASGLAVICFAANSLFKDRIPQRLERLAPMIASAIIVLLVGMLLSRFWEPLGPRRGVIRNFIFVGVMIVALLGFFHLIRLLYEPMLHWCLRHKLLFLSVPTLVVLLGITAWLGFDKVFGFIPAAGQALGVSQSKTRSTVFWAGATKKFPGFGKEFMPPLDEGSYLFMPTTMVHASIGEALDILARQDAALQAIPEVDSVVGKIGRAETPLDPAPISMIETVINYKPQYITDKAGRRVNFRYDPGGTRIFSDERGQALLAPDGKSYRVSGRFPRDKEGRLIPDKSGRPFRLWRPALEQVINPGRQAWGGIRKSDDIWSEIIRATKIPGTTSAPKLQPIMARIVMLQSGMRAPMGVKIKGPTLRAIEKVGLQIERFLKQVPDIEPATVIADRIVGKPYLEIVPDRLALARYGVAIGAFQEVVEVAIGGRKTTTTVEGRERFPVRVRYQRELRDDFDRLGKILVPSAAGAAVPISQLARIRYTRGPQAIKSEDTFLVGYVVFDKTTGRAEVDVVESAQRYLQSKIRSGELVLPRGVSYSFAGSYENQLRAQKTLAVILPIALFVIFLIIYFQFKSITTTMIVFSGIFVAWAGGFLLLWFYSQSWFLNFSVFDVPMRELFQVHTINMSVAVWVGFLALFGIASDNGVIQSTYLDQVFRDRQPGSVEEIRQATVIAAKRRIRPCLMTSATTILALMPVLTSIGRGSDIMVPMAIPSFGGMLVVLISVFVVPVIYCAIKELALRRKESKT